MGLLDRLAAAGRPYVEQAQKVLGPAPRPSQATAGVPYSLVSQVRLDAGGNGTGQVFPSGVDFVVDSRSVNIAGATASGATASEYLNSETSQYLQGTYDGASDSSSRRQLLTPGDVLYIVWADGPPGSYATFRATGLAYPPGQGARNL